MENSFECLKNLHAIVWIMVKPELSRTAPEAGRSILETKTFFSTLEFAAVPNAVTDLFSPMVQQLQEEWHDAYKAADQHLISMVHMIFALLLETLANGLTASESAAIKWY